MLWQRLRVSKQNHVLIVKHLVCLHDVEEKKKVNFVFQAG